MKILFKVLFISVLIPFFAFAAEVSVDSTVNGTAATHNGSAPTVVFVSDQTGYAFYRDSTGSCVYSKTTDGGGAWGAAVTVDSQTDCLKVGVWYDRWTPGDTTGTNMHIVTMDGADLWYTKLNTSGDSLTATVNATGANQGGGFAVANVPSITKSTAEVVYMGVQDAGDSFVIKCGASCDSAINWTEAGTSPFDLAVDYLILMPLSGGNIIVIRDDISADTFGSKVYNSSGNSWDAAWTTIDAAATENGTYDAAFGATVNKTTGNIYLAYAADISILGTNDDIRTAIYSSGAWTLKTDVLTNDTKGITGAKIALDENTGDVYAVYSARTAAGTLATGNVYYKKSTDGMANWGSEVQVNATAGNIYGARVNAMSDERLYSTWVSATTDGLLGNTIADLTSSDATAPAAVADLAVSDTAATAITLTWTAPGDDNNTGTATTYDVRYSTSAIDAGNWAAATQATGEPAPQVAGSSETVTVTGLSQSTTYYFAIKTSDEIPNTSSVSNSPSGTTLASGDTTAPAAVSNLALSSPTTSSITVSWTASGDDNNTGTATTYDLRYSTSIINDSNWNSVNQVTGEPTPSIAGSSESMTVSGLSENTTYYFALKTSDEVPNTSTISNVPSLATSAAGSSGTTSGGGGSGSVQYTILGITGKAYPGAKVILVEKSPWHEKDLVRNVDVSEKGDFNITLSKMLGGNYTYSLVVEDKDGRKAFAKVYNVNFLSETIYLRDIFVPPTIAVDREKLGKGEILRVFGYAYPKTKAIVSIDDDMSYEVLTNDLGRYEVQINTVRFDLGYHVLKSKQRDIQTGKETDWSTTKNIVVFSLAATAVDLNKDGIINIKDWSIFLSRWKNKDKAMRDTVDFNKDGNVDVSDLSIFLKLYKK